MRDFCHLALLIVRPHLPSSLFSRRKKPLEGGEREGKEERESKGGVKDVPGLSDFLPVESTCEKCVRGDSKYWRGGEKEKEGGREGERDA